MRLVHVGVPHTVEAETGNRGGEPTTIVIHNICRPASIHYDSLRCSRGPILPRVLQGKSSDLSANGHTGIGKSHAIIGYDYENPAELGLCLASARDLMSQLHHLNAEDSSDP